MKLVELLIAVSVFVVFASTASLIMFKNEDLLLGGIARTQALRVASQELGSLSDSAESDFDAATKGVSTTTIGSFVVVKEIRDVDNFTKEAVVTAWYRVSKRSVPVSVSRTITDIRESEGQSSCRPIQDVSKWKYLERYTKSVASHANIKATSIVLKGNKVFVSSDSSVASATDLYVFSLDYPARTLLLDYAIDTGPGTKDLAVVGDYIYLANTSINAQVQVVKMSNAGLQLVSQYKLPGIYNDGTTIGNTLFYKKGYLFLGTEKSQVAELHVLSVKQSTNISEVASYEMNTAVNDIYVFKDKIYVASPDMQELKIFSFKDNALNFLFGYDAIGSVSNGKRVMMFLGKVFLGRTVGQSEVYGLQMGSSSLSSVFSFSTGSSVHGLEAYGNLLFLALNAEANSFQVFDISSSVPVKISKTPINLATEPLAMSCDGSMFALIEVGTRITFLTYQR